MGVLSANNSVYWLLLIFVAVASGIQHHSSILSIGRAQNKAIEVSLQHIGGHSVKIGGAVKRQTNQNEAQVCSQILYKTQCTGSYAQNYINSIGQCSDGGLAVAVAAEKLCRQNARGDYCGTVAIDIASIVSADQICTSSCSSSCRSALVSLRNRYGCCLIANPLLQLYTLTLYFSFCDMVVPTSCNKTNLSVPSNPNTGATCGRNAIEVSRTSFRLACTPNLQSTLDTLRENNCDTFAQLNEINCGYRNGRYCYEIALSTSTSNSAVRALTDAASSCLSDTTCSSSCKNAISNLNKEVGCCVNLYNSSLLVYQTTTAGGDLSPFSAITSNNLWAECGITPPGICQARLTDSAISFEVTYNFLMFLMLFFSFIAVV